MDLEARLAHEVKGVCGRRVWKLEDAITDLERKKTCSVKS